MSEIPDNGPQRGGAERSFVGRAAAVLAASMVASRLLGLLRDRVLAHQIGVSAETDAYGAAFLIPDMLNYFLAGGALSIAFIPLYSRVRETSGREEAEALFAKVLGTMTVVAIAATALFWWQAEALVDAAFPRFDPEIRALTVRLTRIVLPAQIFFVAGGIVRAALMAHGRFASQALAPIVYNAGIIAGGVWLGDTLGPEGFAWGVLAGAAIGPFGFALIEFFRRTELRLRVRFAPFDREFLRYLVLAAPLILGVTLLTVDEWYDKLFGALQSEGLAISARLIPSYFSFSRVEARAIVIPSHQPCSFAQAINSGSFLIFSRRDGSLSRSANLSGPPSRIHNGKNELQLWNIAVYGY